MVLYWGNFAAPYVGNNKAHFYDFYRPTKCFGRVHFISDPEAVITPTNCIHLSILIWQLSIAVGSEPLSPQNVYIMCQCVFSRIVIFLASCQLEILLDNQSKAKIYSSSMAFARKFIPVVSQCFFSAIARISQYKIIFFWKNAAFSINNEYVIL